MARLRQHLTSTGIDEGSLRDERGPRDWSARAAKLCSTGKSMTTAELMHAKTFGELSMDARVLSWSRVRFLADEHPVALAAILGGVKGQLDSAGYPSGADMAGLQRALLAEHLGWSPAQFDSAWTAWVAAQK